MSALKTFRVPDRVEANAAKQFRLLPEGRVCKVQIPVADARLERARQHAIRWGAGGRGDGTVEMMADFGEAEAALAAQHDAGEAGARATLEALSVWCTDARSKLSVDGYDYKSGEEYGIRRVELQIEQRLAQTKKPAPARS